jgi:hypothetical protein
MSQHSDRKAENTYETIEAAALRLSTSPLALRARCRRCATKEGKHIVAHLGAEIVAYKLGRTWRVRFPI